MLRDASLSGNYMPDGGSFSGSRYTPPRKIFPVNFPGGNIPVTVFPVWVLHSNVVLWVKGGPAFGPPLYGKCG